MQQHQHGEPLLVEALGEYSADSHVSKRFRPAGKCCRRLCADAQTTAGASVKSSEGCGQDCLGKDSLCKAKMMNNNDCYYFQMIIMIILIIIIVIRRV